MCADRLSDTQALSRFEAQGKKMEIHLGQVIDSWDCCWCRSIQGCCNSSHRCNWSLLITRQVRRDLYYQHTLLLDMLSSGNTSSVEETQAHQHLLIATIAQCCEPGLHSPTILPGTQYLLYVLWMVPHVCLTFQVVPSWFNIICSLRCLRNASSIWAYNQVCLTFQVVPSWFNIICSMRCLKNALWIWAYNQEVLTDINVRT